MATPNAATACAWPHLGRMHKDTAMPHAVATHFRRCTERRGKLASSVQADVDQDKQASYLCAVFSSPPGEFGYSPPVWKIRFEETPAPIRRIAPLTGRELQEDRAGARQKRKSACSQALARRTQNCGKEFLSWLVATKRKNTNCRLGYG